MLPLKVEVVDFVRYQLRDAEGDVAHVAMCLGRLLTGVTQMMMRRRTGSPNGLLFRPDMAVGS